MAEKVEIVIKIPKYYLTHPQDYICLAECVRRGKPLPKGHGDLVDRDEINDRFYGIWRELNSYSNKPSQKELLDKWSMCMDDATPIIEADKESEE